MEYIKKEELKNGDVFVSQLLMSNWLNKQGTNYYLMLNKDNTIAHKTLSKTGGFSYENIRMATSEEKHWLNCCITADKFITCDEAMKTFIPEYYQYIGEINSYRSSFIKGKTYKIINKNDLEASFNFIDEKDTPNGYEGVNWKKFKPSTKEAYDAQFVVKEPEFVLPEKWCLKITKENLDFCKSLENNELKFHKNYPYSIGCYYSPIPNKDCNGFINIPENYTEITFEQFKKYVLKEETAIEFGNKIDKEIIEPLPQFKVIESIETITKVENNEGNQFFIGDIVISDSGFVQTIKSFRYNVNKDNVLATTNICNQISIARLEHYIEPKVEVEETLLEKAKRLYTIGTKFNNYKIAKGVDRTVEVLTTNIIEEFGKIKLLNPEKRRNNNAGTWTLYRDGEFAEIIK